MWSFRLVLMMDPQCKSRVMVTLIVKGVYLNETFVFIIFFRILSSVILIIEAWMSLDVGYISFWLGQLHSYRNSELIRGEI